MILLDTNVISELMAPRDVADPKVMRWVNGCPRNELATTTISLAESLYGAHRLAEGKRKQLLLQSIEKVYQTLFQGRIFDFDRPAAREYALLVSNRRKTGRPLLELDAQIAAIARAKRIPIATHDSDFADCGVTVINPWDYAA